MTLWKTLKINIKDTQIYSLKDESVHTIGTQVSRFFIAQWLMFFSFKFIEKIRWLKYLEFIYFCYSPRFYSEQKFYNLLFETVNWINDNIHILLTTLFIHCAWYKRSLDFVFVWPCVVTKQTCIFNSKEW